MNPVHSGFLQQLGGFWQGLTLSVHLNDRCFLFWQSVKDMINMHTVFYMDIKYAYIYVAHTFFKSIHELSTSYNSVPVFL